MSESKNLTNTFVPDGNAFAASAKQEMTNMSGGTSAFFEKILKMFSIQFIKNPPFGLVNNNIMKKISFAVFTLASLAFIRTLLPIGNTHSMFEFYCISFWFIGIIAMVFVIDPYNIKNVEYMFNSSVLERLQTNGELLSLSSKDSSEKVAEAFTANMMSMAAEL